MRHAVSALQLFFGKAYARTFGVELWDGTRIYGRERERFVLRVKEAGALRVAFRPPFDLSAGRAFAAGLIECDHDVESAVDTLLQAVNDLTPMRAVQLWWHLRHLPMPTLPSLHEAHLRGAVHSRARDLAAIGFHYDLSLQFYAAFLDANLVYSCAYYRNGITTLDAAQNAKLDYILRKLRVSPGERFLDIGCGWGALIIRAAQCGATALGITLSHSQYEEARRRIEAAGVADRARVELRDYRDLAGEQFDKIASVGMFEHVGRVKLREYFSAANAALRPGGLFLNHAIAAHGLRTTHNERSFIERFVFPDGELVSIVEALECARAAGFEVRDVESLREHYTKTLRAWVTNLERNRLEAVAAASEESYRVWRLYMAASAQGFRTGRLNIYQSLLARPRPDGSIDMPSTREDIYST